MSKMNLSFRVVNPDYSHHTKGMLVNCYDHLKMVTGFAESYGMPPVEFKLVTDREGDTTPDDYIEIRFKTDLVSEIYVKVLKDLLHIVKGFGCSDCCYQTSPILKRKD